MILPIWGSEYIERWLDLTFPALRSDGNVLYLNEHSDFEIAILTMAADIDYMRGDARFNNLIDGISVVFISIDEFFPAHGTTPYSIPLTLAYAKGVLDLGDKAIGTYIILWQADGTIASGSFKSVLNRIRDGFTFIGVAGLRADDDRTRIALYERVDKETGILSISPREMVALANANLHGTAGSRTLNEHGPIDTFHFHQLFWRISEDCIAMRGFLVHPLCFRVERIIDKVLCPNDYGFASEMCPDGKFCMMDDSDDFMALELQTRDSEGHLLRLARKGESAPQRLARLSGEIAANAATWTTEDHRRNAMFTVYYHEKYLPADLAERVAPFDALVDEILAKLPPAVSHIGHPHWLPAVQAYRQDMVDGGGDPNVVLLDDPRNAMPTLPPPPQKPSILHRHSLFARIAYVLSHRQDWVRGLPKRIYRDRLADIIKARLVTNRHGLNVIHLGDIDVGNHVKPLWPGVRTFDFGNPAGPEASHDFSVKLPEVGETDNSEAVLVYAPAGFLSLWDRLPEDAEAFLVDRKQFVLVLVQDNFAALDVADHSYMLSILFTCFPTKKYDVDVDVYLAPEREPALIEILLFLARSKVVAVLRLIGLCRPRLPAEPGDPPPRFSALVISAKQRD